MDILWHIPATKDMHGLVRLAAEMTRNRMAAKELPPFKDLMSYLVRIIVALTTALALYSFDLHSLKAESSSGTLSAMP